MVRFAPDYEHRVRCINFHIALESWAKQAEQAIVWYRQYFDWSTATATRRPQPATRLALTHKRIDADALFLLRDPTGIERVFVFEMANGTDTGRVLQKMQHISQGIADGSINRALSFAAGSAVRILFVFDCHRTAELVQAKAARLPILGDYLPHFYLKPIDELSADTFQHGWWSLERPSEMRLLF